MNNLRVRLQGLLTAEHVTVAGPGPPPTLALPLPPSPSVQDTKIPQHVLVLSQGFHNDLQDNVFSPQLQVLGDSSGKHDPVAQAGPCSIASHCKAVCLLAELLAACLTQSCV